MKREYKLAIATAILLILAITCSFLIRARSFVPKQQKLAQELGVNIEDYPYPNEFPAGYFGFVLKKGMSTNEVPTLIKGYDVVYKCEKRFAEIYYYFSTDDSKALRFIVYYDIDYRYDKLNTEDEDSRTILLNSCVPGAFNS